MSEAKPLTVEECRQMAVDWYKKLDVHAPMVEVLPMLDDANLRMVFPEVTVYGQAGFEGWFQTVIRIFFDEEHELKEFSGTPDGDKMNIKLVVKWAASKWNPPAAYSDRIVLDAYQTWVMIRHPRTGLPVVETYVVDKLEYYEGSAKL